MNRDQYLKLCELREQAKRDGNPILRDKSFELLIKTVEELKPKSIIEVGTNVGLSSIAILLSSEGSTLTGIELDEQIADRAKNNYKQFGLENRSKIFIGDASKIVPLLTGNYDFIFLDGPKSHYLEYAENLLPLLNKGGVMFCDNVLFRGYVLSSEKPPQKYHTIVKSLRQFIERITTDKNLDTTIYHIEDGVSITRRIN